MDCHTAVNKLYCVEAILIENTTLFLAPPSVDIAIGEDQHQELSFKYKALSCWTQNRHVYNGGCRLGMYSTSPTLGIHSTSPTLGIVKYKAHTTLAMQNIRPTLAVGPNNPHIGHCLRHFPID